MFTNFIELSNVKLYIDPATTSYVIQIVAGIVIAIGAGAGIFWSKLKRAVSGKNKDKNASENLNLADSDSGTKEVITAEDLLDEEDK